MIVATEAHKGAMKNTRKGTVIHTCHPQSPKRRQTLEPFSQIDLPSDKYPRKPEQ